MSRKNRSNAVRVEDTNQVEGQEVEGQTGETKVKTVSQVEAQLAPPVNDEIPELEGEGNSEPAPETEPPPVESEPEPETAAPVESTADALIRLYGNKSNAIRALHGAGKKTAEIAKLLGIRYQHARNVILQPLKREIKAARDEAQASAPATAATAAPTPTPVTESGQ